MRGVPGSLAALLLTGAAVASTPDAPFEIDQPFPALLFPALEDGRPTSLADFRGKKTVLHVFASW